MYVQIYLSVCAQSFSRVTVKPECQEFCIWMYIRLSLSSIDLKDPHSELRIPQITLSWVSQWMQWCHRFGNPSTPTSHNQSLRPCFAALALPRCCRSFQAGRDHFFSSAAEGDFGCRFTAARICKGRYGCKRILILTAMWLKQCHKPPHFWCFIPARTKNIDFGDCFLFILTKFTCLICLCMHLLHE